MIDAKELRVGNLAYYEICDRTKHIGTVTSIRGFKSCKGFESVTATYNDWNIVEPIQLTEEIILKTPFVKSIPGVKHYNFEVETKTGSRHLSIQKHEAYPDGYILFLSMDGVAAPPSVYLESLHELQNFFYTWTKEELPINL